VEDDIAEINQDPALPRASFAAGGQLVLFVNRFRSRVCQGLQHSIAGARADDKVISKGSDTLNIQQNNILPFFRFQGIDN